MILGWLFDIPSHAMAIRPTRTRALAERVARLEGLVFVCLLARRTFGLGLSVRGHRGGQRREGRENWNLGARNDVGRGEMLPPPNRTKRKVNNRSHAPTYEPLSVARYVGRPSSSSSRPPCSRTQARACPRHGTARHCAIVLIVTIMIHGTIVCMDGLAMYIRSRTGRSARRGGGEALLVFAAPMRHRTHGTFR